ncbi:endonuclease [Flavilitoribacter nigricans]|uniref:Endonuclease I n=1 Tax=Flavilitoribacter nigricans (strain ATCC 23147 / DSM 23189 / NBRC 102662 / NCIMB 1420 / SS-2) TaxID=1122177 RepID=A0A2D0N473_FLAN2|nr:endonuclease [Flavilitoribacter nigricans]PHN03352.1 endonuclease I [Flavilitoribacter nigricans DSM 23189 = NBRC 102662]
MLTAHRRSLLSIILYCWLGFSGVHAQTSVFPALGGEELLDSLVSTYKPASGLNYGNARDTLYGRILNQNDSLVCIYTGYRIYLPPGLDPTMAAFDAGINTEHAYPRSKGAEEDMARSDMHHLFPSRVDVNSDRGDLPFGEVPDPQTTAWYYLDRKQSATPTDNIDAYSELGNGQFEVRENSKGDIARAMFYFYTMYRTEAELADRDFFPDQKNTLCDWHVLDPVDQQEWDRNAAIAAYQDNKPNPYILDCTLAYRAFCPERTPPACGFTRVKDVPPPRPFRTTDSAPNPFTDQFTFEYELSEVVQVHIQLVDALGRPLRTLVDARQSSGSYRSQLNTQPIPAGLYSLQFEFRTPEHTWWHTQKLIKL